MSTRRLGFASVTDAEHLQPLISVLNQPTLNYVE